ncbi:MAG: NifU family protein [Flavobacteriales bacterium]|jgi:NFU1 iron-sulfur cluster scaffold homolog, mitochondrial|nr:NifU family protein [Flavobacteriales bacterium]MBT5089700.1 NifU family protein [Flavobacteriales bacterium]MBT5749808.1 NifU family protein [Flavobacteriales bacterium]
MNYSIYAESTPNPGVMKFVANRMLVDKSIEITQSEQAKDISVAKALFNFPFVKSLYLSSNFISIAKTDNVEWDVIAMQLRNFITDFLNEKGLKNYTENITDEERIKTEVKAEKNTVKIEFTDKEKAIIDLLNEYIKPAVEADGGAITFNSYVGDVVTVNLKGACSGCPSATSTLKGGIESLLNQKVDPNIVVRANEG